MKKREESRSLLHQYIEESSLRHHCEMVATACEAYSVALGKEPDEVEIWWSAGLLHDLDWEKYPDEHPKKAVNEILPDLGYPQTLIDAVEAHAPDRTGKQPNTELERYLFACDELSGFMHAVSLMRPTGFDGMNVKSVTKKLKTVNFAANVSRDDIHQGAELIGKPLNDHIQFLIGVFNT